MLSEKEVKHIAQLARIKLSDEEEKRLSKDLSSILDYVAQLNEVDTEGVEPLYQAGGAVNQTRADEQTGWFNLLADDKDRLVGQAPHLENRFIKVKSVLRRQ